MGLPLQNIYKIAANCPRVAQSSAARVQGLQWYQHVGLSKGAGKKSSITPCKTQAAPMHPFRSAATVKQAQIQGDLCCISWSEGVSKYGSRTPPLPNFILAHFHPTSPCPRTSPLATTHSQAHSGSSDNKGPTSIQHWFSACSC